MKTKITLGILMAFLSIFQGYSQTQFWSDNFEDAGAPSSGTRTPSVNFSCGGTPATNYFYRSDLAGVSLISGTYSGFDGSKFWAGEDIDFGPTCTNASISANQQVTWSVNIAGKTGLSFKGFFAANGAFANNWEGSSFTTSQDYMMVEYRIDGGAWNKAIVFYASATTQSQTLKLETTGDLIGDGADLTYAFTEYAANLVGTGTTLDIRLNVFANGSGTEELAIDNFRLFETPSCTAPTIVSNPPNRSICVNGNTTFSSSASGATSYQWQVNTGSGFTDISNGGVYSGATTTTLTVTGATAGMNGYLYRCRAMNGVASCFTNSNSGTLNISNITSSTAQNNVACFGTSTGSAAVSPTGGIGGYTYSWSPSGGTASIATGLAAGSYTVTITDGISCQITKNFTITQPPALSMTASSQTNVSCFGGSNGVASVNAATGGTPSYTYDWTPGTPTGDGTTTVTGLTAGTWTVTVTDANSCTKSQSFTITAPPAISMTASSQTNVSCFGGSNGAAAVNAATGGSGGFTYDWTPGTPTGDGTTTVTGLTAGTWTVTVTDANSCTKSQSFTITAPSAISMTASSQTNVSCFGGSNGAAAVNAATGGSGGFTYDWTPGTPTGDGTTSVTGLTAGTWTVTVTDANSCTKSQSFTITAPSAISMTASSQTNVSCFGGSNGAAAVNAATGGSGGFTYDWTPGTPTGDGTTAVTGLTAGTWTVTVTDANSCTKSQSFTITAPSAISMTASSQTNISCFGGSNGAASVNAATGGSGGYTYDWTPGTPTGDGTTSVTGLTAGTWTVTVTDANSCTKSQSFTITAPSAISMTASSQTNVSCFGGSNGAAAVNAATGGSGGFTYDWTPGTPAGDGTTSITGLTAGTWTCTVTDANACVASQSFTVTQPSAISVTTASQTNVSCFGGSNGAASINIPTGGAGGYTYDWTPGTPTGDGTVSVNGLTSGTYTVTVTDANACIASQSFTITQPATALSASAGSQTDVSCNGGSNGTATVVPTGGTTSYTYSWSPTGGTGSTASGLSAGTYTVTVTDANTCQDTKTFTIAEPLPLDLSNVSQVDVLCNGGATGSATVTPTGGTGTYTYSWAPTGGTGATASGLTAGTYTVTVTDANTCQATHAFTLTESAPITSSFAHTTCGTYVWGTQSHNTSGTYTQTFTAVNGCDSVVTLNLTISPAITNTVTVNNCGAYTWAQNGTTYATSGMYIDTIPSAGGCDSIVTLDLTINSPSSSSSSDFACGAYTWAQNGMTYTSSGVYTDTIPNAAGCDSIVTLNLTIGGSSATQSVTACDHYMWTQNGINYTASGIYSDTLTGAGGCDSILVLNLTIVGSPVATATDNGNATITASAGTTYQWINCTTNTAVSGATAQTFAPSANGTYAVVITNAGNCSDTSNCVVINNVGIAELNSNAIQVFPNPTDNQVTITMMFDQANLIITDVHGKTQFTGKISNGQLIDLANYEDGVYFLSIQTEAGTVLKRIVKN